MICAVFSVSVFEIYYGFGSVTVFLKVTNFGYGSVNRSFPSLYKVIIVIVQRLYNSI